jgi:hypothetical protein
MRDLVVLFIHFIATQARLLGPGVILSLLCQVLADAAVLPTPLLWLVRIGVPLAAILISAGFFFSVLPPTATQASGAVVLIYTGAVILALAVVTLGVGLLRSPQAG